MSWSTVEIDDLEEPGWREVLAEVLRQLGAKRIWHAKNEEVYLGWYRVGFLPLKGEWDIWTGLLLSGPNRIVEPVAERLRPLMHSRRD